MTSATEELCRLLDERGVKWTYEYGIVCFSNEERWFKAWAYNDRLMCVSTGYYTPEQAIAATLGSEDTYTREDVESAFTSGYSLGCLPVGSDPSWDENRQTVDEHMAELGWVRAATLGAGECKVESTTKWDWDRCEPYWQHELSCGHTVTTMEPEPPNYCPECGRKVVVE